MCSTIRNGGGDGTDVFGKIDTPFSTPAKLHPLSGSALKFKSSSKVHELATHPNITRRRALTLAEFNPSHTVNRSCKRELELSYGQMEPELEQLKKNTAGRRIYQLLLLNAWRKRKIQTQAILDSKKALEMQNAKLEVQVDALHRFRIAESEKREEAVSNFQSFEQEFEENLSRSKALIEEKFDLENEMSKCEQILSELQLQTKNAKNELMTKHCSLVTKKCQLAVAQNKIKGLSSETKMGITQGSMMEIEVTKLCNEVEELQKQLLETELKLQDTMFNNNNFESENKELFEKLRGECAKRKALEDHNADLKSSLTLAQAALSKELNKGLWKNTEIMMLVCLKSLKAIAIAMLPALPENIFEND